MARLINRLSARQVDLASAPGRYGDGAGLHLVVGANGRKHWVFRYRLQGARRDMGLGAAGKGGVSLAHARVLAADARKQLAEGRDPLQVRANGQAAERAPRAASRVPTFGMLADEVVSALEAGWRNPKHRAQWRMTLLTYCAPLRSRRVDEIGTDDVVAVLKPIWLAKPETATRVRGRIEKVLDAAMARGHRQTANPARWRGHLDHLLPARPKIAPRHHPAMPWTLIPSFVLALQARDGIAARAVEFLLLSATRSGEVRGARWDEIDLAAKIWTIPPARMKAGREHRVPLTDRCIELLRIVRPLARPDGYVFPGARPGRPLSDMSLGAVLKRMDLRQVTAHGFRSGFRDWAGEATEFPREIVEAALAHVVGGPVERAYRRGDALERRRAVMDAWASYCLAETTGQSKRVGERKMTSMGERQQARSSPRRR
jgi:integrase